VVLSDPVLGIQCIGMPHVSRLLPWMLMNVLIAGTGLFAASFLTHVILWRIRVPRREWLTLLLVFAALPPLALTAALNWPRVPVFDLAAPRVVLVVFLSGGFGIVYLILFSALQADSPTLTMIQLIRSHQATGITEDELARSSVERGYSRVRFEQMLRDGLAKQVGQQICVTPIGRRFASIVLWNRRLLGLHRASRVVTSPKGG